MHRRKGGGGGGLGPFHTAFRKMFKNTKIRTAEEAFDFKKQ